MAKSIRRIIGENIRVRRLTLGLTQEQLGNQIGYSWKWVSKVELCDRPIPLEVLPRLQVALDVTDYRKLFENDAFL